MIGMLKRSLFLGALALSVSGAQAAPAKTHGVLGLYGEIADSVFVASVDKLGERVSAQGCAVARAGKVVGANGDIGLDAPGRFVYLTCERPVLTKAAKRGMFAQTMGKPVALMEGVIVAAEAGNVSVPASSRAYLLKVSYYNNARPDARDADLAAIGEVTAPLDDRYVNEIAVEVHRAIGLPTPDEFVLIHYDSPAHGDRFRENNQDVLEKVGAFNKAHLTKFVYYPAAAYR